MKVSMQTLLDGRPFGGTKNRKPCQNQRPAMGPGSLSIRDGYYSDGSTWVSLYLFRGPANETASFDGCPKWLGGVLYQKVQRGRHRG
jgi:hypothetical protein